MSKPELKPGQLVNLPLKELWESPALGDLAPIADDDETVVKIFCSLKDGDVLHVPLQITPDGAYCDGRKRFRAAKKAQLAEVPCLVVTPEEATRVILTSLECRAHQTPGQRAYDLVPALQHVFAAVWAKRMQNLGGKAPENYSLIFGEGDEKKNELEKWADKLGLSVETLRLANRVRRLFEDKNKRTITERDPKGKVIVQEKETTFKKFYEPRLFRADKPYSLSGIISGITSILATEQVPSKKGGGKPKEVSKKVKLFAELGKTLKARASSWEGFDEDQRETAFKPFKSAFEKMPDALLETLDKSLREEKRRRQAVKEGN